jgi:flagellar biosynthesis chaperone FliJ
MNKARRKQLADIASKIEELREELESIMNDEEEYRDNMPENMQESERYEKSDEACYEMQNAIDSLEEAISSIETSQE